MLFRSAGSNSQGSSGQGEISQIQVAPGGAGSSVGGSDIEIPENVMKQIAEKIAELQKQFGEGEQAGSLSAPSFDVEGDEKNKVTDKELQELNGTRGRELITYLRGLPPQDPSAARRFEEQTSARYGQAITSFRKLFSGGWRAPRRGVKMGTEVGNLETDLLYKARLKGKDRGLYSRPTIKTLPGVNILVCIDNSGSMDSYTDKIAESGIVLHEAVKGLHKNTKMRVVFFSNQVFIAKDWDDKKYKSYSIQTLKEHQSGTPTGRVLKHEYSNFISQEGDKFLVVVTDGQPNDRDSVTEEIARLKKKGVFTLLIRFGGRGNTNEGFDEVLSYSSQRLPTLPNILAQDVQKLIGRYAKKKMRAVS